MSVYAIILLLAFLSMVGIGTVSRGNRLEPGAGLFLVLGLIGLVAVIRSLEILNYFQLWMAYGSMVTINYVITFFAAYFLYEDPASEKYEIEAAEYLLTNRVKVAYVVPVYNEPHFILRCIDSIISAAEFAASKNIEVTIVVVNDCSTDSTWESLQAYEGNSLVKLINLSKNAGKKGALTIGMTGGENWREAYTLFELENGRMLGYEDYPDFLNYLRKAECTPPAVDFFMHTDSDSVVSREFIYRSVVAFLTHPKLGALSGHCDVWLDESPQTLFTKMQIAWYGTQFRVRKAAESAYKKVFCVSGPGAGFRSQAVYPVLPKWVDDQYGPRIYKGATDRMITLLILKQGWDIEYSARAWTSTVVPSSLTEARSQWTRWKQNFWRMLKPVWGYAWKAPLPLMYLTYSRLIVTILAPFIMIDHVFAISLGDYGGVVTYVIGLMVMGSIMGVAYASHNPDNWKYALLRPLMSLVSAIWGSSLTLRAFYLDRKQVFTWREGGSTKRSKGRILNRWFIPTFEIRLFTWIMIIISLVYLAKILISLG